MEDQSRSTAKNPYALETAQDATECFEIYEIFSNSVRSKFNTFRA